MKYMLILSILFLLLAACGGETVVSKQGVKDTTSSKTIGAADEGSGPEDIQAETEAKNDATKNLVIPTPIKTGKIGSTAVFGAMINKVNLQPDKYFLKITFIEARDTSFNNKIEVDKDIIKTWIKSGADDFDLVDSKFVPISINIGNEVKSGAATVPGSYQFEVQLYKRVDVTFDTEISGAIKQIYLKVK